MTAALHRQPAFRLLWFGEGVSVLGNATSSILIPLLAIVDLHASAWWMGLLTAAAWLPWLVIGLPVGAFVDRLPGRAVMICADLVSAGALASVPIAWAADALTLPQLIAVAIVNGTCTVFFRSAYPALVTRVVAPDDLTGANARMFGTEAAAKVAGPGVGGWLAGAFGAVSGVVVDALSFAVSALCLWRIPLRARAVRAEPDGVSLGKRIGDGLRVVYADPLLRFMTISGGVSNFGLTGFDALTVLFLVRSGGLSSTVIGALLAAGSLGGVVGAGCATRLTTSLGSARALVVFQLVAGPAPLMLGLAGPGAAIALVPIALAALSGGVVAGNVIKGGFRMRYVPAHLQARAVTATQLINFGTMPVAGLCAGWLGTALGLRTTIVVMAAIHATASLAILRSPIARYRDLPAVAPTAASAATKPALAGSTA